MRAIPNIANLLKVLDDITKQFIPSRNYTLIPSISRCISCSDVERGLLSLPTRMEGPGTAMFSKIADFEYANSTLIT